LRNTEGMLRLARKGA